MSDLFRHAILVDSRCMVRLATIAIWMKFLKGRFDGSETNGLFSIAWWLSAVRTFAKQLTVEKADLMSQRNGRAHRRCLQRQWMAWMLELERRCKLVFGHLVKQAKKIRWTKSNFKRSTCRIGRCLKIEHSFCGQCRPRSWESEFQIMGHKMWLAVDYVLKKTLLREINIPITDSASSGFSDSSLGGRLLSGAILDRWCGRTWHGWGTSRVCMKSTRWM